MNLLDTIERLTTLQGGAGFEGEVAALMSGEMRRLGARVHVDTMGNVIGQLGADDQACRVMVCAHMDEVSLIVKYIDDDGLIYCDAIGTINTTALPATSVDICSENGLVPGVIAARSRHLLSSEAMTTAPQLEDLWIEVGARCAADVRALGINVGDNITFHPNFRKLGNGYFTSKSIDNRVGCAILLGLIETLRDRPRDYSLYLAACVQEEVGSRGAGVAARTLQPNLALVVDTVSAAEPEIPPRRASARIGGGPVLRAMDILPSFLGTLYSPRIRRRLAATAERNGIPYQHDVAQTWTDAANIHTSGPGIPSGGIFIPRRGSHSPAEVACLFDVEHAFRLVRTFLADLTAQDIASLIAPPGNT